MINSVERALGLQKLIGTHLKNTVKVKLKPAIRVSSFLKLSEPDFSKIVIELEKDPVFFWLRKQKVITYKKVSRFYYFPIEENIALENQSPKTQEILASHKEGIELIKQIGEEEFCKFFLYPEKHFEPEEIEKKCLLEKEEIEKINRVIDAFVIHSGVLFQTTLNIGKRHQRYTKIGRVERDGKNLRFIFFNPIWYAGKYKIDYDKLSELKKDERYKKIKEVLEKINLVNQRKHLLRKIMGIALEKQKKFFMKNDSKSLKIYPQKQLAVDISTTPSSISRILYLKSIVLSNNFEIPLRILFPKQSEIKLVLTNEIVGNSKRKLTAKEIKFLIKKKFNLNIPRRTISAYCKKIERGTFLF